MLLTSNYYDRDIEFTFDQTALIFFFDQLFAPEPFSGVPNGIGGVSPFLRDLVETTTQPQDRQVWSTELRFASNFDGPLQFVAGGLIEREDRNFAIKVTTANEFGRPEAPFDTSTDFIFGADGVPFNGDEGSRVFGLDRTTRIDQEALFGEVTFDAIGSIDRTGRRALFPLQAEIGRNRDTDIRILSGNPGAAARRPQQR